MVNDLVKVVSKLLQHAHPLIHTHTLHCLYYIMFVSNSLNRTISSLGVPQKVLTEELVVILSADPFSITGSFVHQVYINYHTVYT